MAKLKINKGGSGTMKKTLNIKRHAWKRVTFFGVKTFGIIKTFMFQKNVL